LIKRCQVFQIPIEIARSFLHPGYERGWLRRPPAAAIHHNPSPMKGKCTMRTQAHHARSTDSSAAISQADSSSFDSSTDEQDEIEGNYAEGVTSPTEVAENVSINHLCPAPVRAVVSVFSALTALSGLSIAIFGGNALNDPTDPQPDLHRALAGAGAAMLGLGLIGVLSTRLTTSQPATDAATA